MWSYGNDIGMTISVFFRTVQDFWHNAWWKEGTRGGRPWKGQFLGSFHVQMQHTAQPVGENTDENSLCLISVIKMTAIKPKTQRGKISWVLIDCRSQEQ